MLRSFSLFIRKLKRKKDVKKTLSVFDEWSSLIGQLPEAKVNEKKLLIIRLDDIGDYLLFRNSLYTYTNCERWQNYEITLLGNTSWKEIFDLHDINTTHNAMWINKHEYFGNSEYRTNLWNNLRKEGYETVICTSRSRPLLLDDMCLLSAGAPNRIAGSNNFIHSEWNIRSDRLYTELYDKDTLKHEFFYNQDFTNWCCGTNSSLLRPELNLKDRLLSENHENRIVCFIGASKKSRVWIALRWIAFINLCKENLDCSFILTGGKQEIDFAQEIETATKVENSVGKVSLEKMIQLVAGASLVVTHNTMAAHLAISLGKPTLIITNGDNFYGFTSYREAGIKGVRTVYPEVFLNTWQKLGSKPFKGYEAVTKDISTIEAETVYSELLKLIEETNTNRILKK